MTQTRHPQSQLCRGCQIPWPPFFMINDDLWLEVVKDKSSLLCWECFEAMLGRKITAADLKPRAVNRYWLRRLLLEEKPKALAILSEHLLHEAGWTIEFLHSCLTGGAKYAYPDQTLRTLQEIRELAPPPKLCHHSGFEPQCSSCRERGPYLKARQWAKERMKRR